MAVSMREGSPDVDAWVQTSMSLIEAASAYAEGGQYDADTDGKIRRIRVIATALQSALQTINILPPMVVPPTPTSVAPPMPPEPQAQPVEPPPAPEPRVSPRRS